MAKFSFDYMTSFYSSFSSDRWPFISVQLNPWLSNIWLWPSQMKINYSENLFCCMNFTQGLRVKSHLCLQFTTVDTLQNIVLDIHREYGECFARCFACIYWIQIQNSIWTRWNYLTLLERLNDRYSKRESLIIFRIKDYNMALCLWNF